MPKHVESRVGEVHDYFHGLSTDFPDDFPDDFPSERFEHLSADVTRGMQHLWTFIHMRRYIASEFTNLVDRRQLELEIREKMAHLRAEEPAETSEIQKRDRKIGRLLIVHHLSVTADQAELCATAFVQ